MAGREPQRFQFENTEDAVRAVVIGGAYISKVATDFDPDAVQALVRKYLKAFVVQAPHLDLTFASTAEVLMIVGQMLRDELQLAEGAGGEE